MPQLWICSAVQVVTRAPVSNGYGKTGQSVFGTYSDYSDSIISQAEAYQTLEVFSCVSHRPLMTTNGIFVHAIYRIALPRVADPNRHQARLFSLSNISSKFLGDGHAIPALQIRNRRFRVLDELKIKVRAL